MIYSNVGKESFPLKAEGLYLLSSLTLYVCIHLFSFLYPSLRL